MYREFFKYFNFASLFWTGDEVSDDKTVYGKKIFLNFIIKYIFSNTWQRSQNCKYGQI